MTEDENKNEKDTSNESYQNGSTANGNDMQLQQQSTKAIADLDNVEEEKPISLKQYLKSIFVMPPSMRILALTNLFCWMGHVTYCLYFTDFVGEAVFNGDPTVSNCIKGKKVLNNL